MRLQNLIAASLQLLPATSASLSLAAHSNYGQSPLISTAKGFNCDLPAVQPPPDDGFPSADIFSTDVAFKKQIERHSAIVKVPTICFDDLGQPGEDDRYAPFYELHDVLEKTFPLV